MTNEILEVQRTEATGTLPDQRPILLAKLRARFENWLPFYMAGAES
jgi:hypothetical protein